MNRMQIHRNSFVRLFLFSEILRVIDSLKLTARQKVATPVDWQVNIEHAPVNLKLCSSEPKYKIYSCSEFSD